GDPPHRGVHRDRSQRFTAEPTEVTPRTPARNSPQRPPRSQRTDRDDERTIGVRYGFDSGIPSQDDVADRSIQAPPVRAKTGPEFTAATGEIGEKRPWR